MINRDSNGDFVRQKKEIIKVKEKSSCNHQWYVGFFSTWVNNNWGAERIGATLVFPEKLKPFSPLGKHGVWYPSVLGMHGFWFRVVEKKQAVLILVLREKTASFIQLISWFQSTSGMGHYRERIMKKFHPIVENLKKNGEHLFESTVFATSSLLSGDVSSSMQSKYKLISFLVLRTNWWPRTQWYVAWKGQYGGNFEVLYLHVSSKSPLEQTLIIKLS